MVGIVSGGGGNGDVGSGDQIRVGVLGYGLAGSAFHAPLIAATPGLQ